jgi:hypothetical protein
MSSSVEVQIQRAGLKSRASGPHVVTDVCRAIILTLTVNGTERQTRVEGECADGISWDDVVQRVNRVTGGNRRSVSS